MTTRPVSIRLRLAEDLPTGCAWVADTEPEYADLRHRAERLAAAEAAHAERAAARRAAHDRALAEHRAAEAAAILAGTVPPPAPEDPGPEPGRWALTDERLAIKAEAAAVWARHGRAIAERLTTAYGAQVTAVDTELADLNARVAELRERREAPANRRARLAEALANMPSLPAPRPGGQRDNLGAPPKMPAGRRSYIGRGR